MTLVRNETQKHSAALKSVGQSPIGLFPLKIEILHRRESALHLVTCRDRSGHVNSKIMHSNDIHCVSYSRHSDCLRQNGISESIQESSATLFAGTESCGATTAEPLSAVIKLFTNGGTKLDNSATKRAMAGFPLM